MGFYCHLRGANKMACNKLALNKFNNIGLPILRNLTIFSLQKWLFHEILANKTVHKYFLHCLSTAHPDPSSEGLKWIPLPAGSVQNWFITTVKVIALPIVYLLHTRNYASFIPLLQKYWHVLMQRKTSRFNKNNF